MLKDLSIKKVIVIGSGPIIIGQAAEFDYAGTQACKALREEGVEVVLLNSNPATIMTDDDVADRVYLQPINIDSLEYIIEREKPDGILASLGGQTGLNLVTEAYKKGILQKYNVRVLGTTVDAIQKAENRESFKKLMLEIAEPVPESAILNDVESTVKFAEKIGYPIVIRPAYTLGGTGGGIAHNEEELRNIAYQGLISSPISQVLAEKSVAGLKEIEYEVMRDSSDTAISVCNMENIDAIGVHTGDSIVIAPSQTLTDKEYQKLRSVSLKIIRALKIEGGCNIQFALNSENSEYYVIEVNPRVSRSSALASKATGYPIARITAKIAIGMNLNEIKNTVTGKTTAAFEPALDYVVLKIPKWPFDKFYYADRTMGTQMKATGEVMAIDRTFERTLMKAVICLEEKSFSDRLFDKLSVGKLKNKLKNADDKRLFVIAEALRKNLSVDEIAEITKIDPWFILKIQNIVEVEKRLKNEKLSDELFQKAKKTGFTDEEIFALTGERKENNLRPVYKIVDTCAAEFEAESPYYYSTYEDYDENNISSNKKVIVIGSGPIRIGQGIEFDYCSVQAVQGIKENGYDAIIINNNPETVSTDFDISDKLYFEPLDVESVENIVREEKPEGIILQFGGQTSLNIAPKLSKDIKVLGTSVESINIAEDREQFEQLLKELNIRQPESIAITNVEEAKKGAEKIGYPVLLRPSYVTGGMAMKMAYNEEELISFVNQAVKISPEYPVAMDKFISGKEFEADILSDGKDILIPGFMEHIEKAGVHSGDSFCSYPPQTLSEKVINKALDYSEKIAKALKVKGLLNIQFIADGDEVYVIEVNPRASRTVPMMSKVTKIPMVRTAVKLMFGHNLKEQGFGTGLFKTTNLVVVKAPVFSFQKLTGTDVSLCTEMKSTGEVLGIDTVFEKALTKAFISSGIKLVHCGNAFVSVNEEFSDENLIKRLIDNGFNIVTTEKLDKDFISEMKQGKINLIFSLPKENEAPEIKKIRELSYIYGIPCFTRPETLTAYLSVLEYMKENPTLDYKTIEEYMK